MAALLSFMLPSLLAYGLERPAGHTRSIVACDPGEFACGIASASFPAVPGTVAMIEPGVVVANQSVPHYATAKSVVALVDTGTVLATAMEVALASSPYPDWQQIAAVAMDPAESSGVARAVFTGADVNPQACAVTGDSFAVAANFQASSGICEEMARIYAESEGRLAIKLLKSLVDASEAGGDSRGEFSATVLVYSSDAAEAAISPVRAIANVNRSVLWKLQLRWELLANLATETPPDLRDYIELTPAGIWPIQWVFQQLGFYSEPLSGEWSEAMEFALDHFCQNNTFHQHPSTVRSDNKRYLDSILIDYIVMGYFRGVLRDSQSGPFGY